MTETMVVGSPRHREYQQQCISGAISQAKSEIKQSVHFDKHQCAVLNKVLENIEKAIKASV